jgi:hypothetical protein
MGDFVNFQVYSVVKKFKRLKLLCWARLPSLACSNATPQARLSTAQHAYMCHHAHACRCPIGGKAQQVASTACDPTLIARL